MMTGFLPWNIRSLTGFTAIGICLVYLSLGICPSTPTSLWQKEEFWLLKTFKSWNLHVFLIICHSPLYSSTISCFWIFCYSFHNSQRFCSFLFSFCFFSCSSDWPISVVLSSSSLIPLTPPLCCRIHLSRFLFY